jgi:selenocysteine-specific elongation factor
MVKLFIGATETLAQLRLLGSESLQPGEEGFLQLKLVHPVVAMRGDRYILRLPSPSETLGGGSVLDAHPRKLHRRFDALVLQELQSLQTGNPDEVLMQALASLGISTVAELLPKTGLAEEQALAHIRDLAQQGEITVLKPDPNPQKSLLLTTSQWEKLKQNILQSLQAFHQANPLQVGMAREALRSQLKLSPVTFEAALNRLVSEGLLEQHEALVAMAGHNIRFTPVQQASANALLEKFNASPYTPPDAAEAQETVGEDLLKGMVSAGILKPVSEQILFTPAALEEMTAWVRTHLQEHGSLTLAEFRDHFQTSRKYAAAFLEYLDAKGVTLRKGDARVLNQIK